MAVALGPLLLSALSWGQVLDIAATPARTGSVQGRVTDESGKGVSGAKVQVYNMLAGDRDLSLQNSPNTGCPPDCVTDGDGRFSLRVAEGTLCDIWFMKRGFAVAFLQNVSPRRNPLEVELGRGLPVTGTVRARNGGNLFVAPGETVRLSLAPREATWVGCITEQRTDADGRYEFRLSSPPPRTGWEVSFAGNAVPVGLQGGELPESVDFLVETEVARRPAQQPAGAANPAGRGAAQP
jgi:hypothetical protein